MLAVSGAALVTGAITGGLALAQSSDNNDQPVYDVDGTQVGTGHCASGGQYADFGQGGALYDENGVPIEDVTDCGYGLHHTATAMLAIGATGLVGAAIYYFFFMRPSEKIERLPRGPAISADQASAKVTP